MCRKEFSFFSKIFFPARQSLENAEFTNKKIRRAFDDRGGLIF
jgi:hypothetical protein